MTEEIRKEEPNNKRVGLGTILAGLFLIVAVTFLMVYVSPKERADVAIAASPGSLAIYDILIEINPGDTYTNFKCRSTVTDKYLGEFNASAFMYHDTIVDYTTENRNGVQVQYRVKYPRLDYEEIMSPGLIKLLNESESESVNCYGHILTSDNHWTYEVYDNGKKDTESLNLWESLYIKCGLNPHPIGELEWDCFWEYDFTRINKYDLSQRIQRDTITLVLDKEGGY